MLSFNLITILFVALGGAIGSVLRYGSIQLVMVLHPAPFPLGTMLVNIAGSFLIGLLMSRYALTPSPSAQLFFVTGMLGGFTTFSAFSWDALQLVQRGAAGMALCYVLGSILLSFAAVAAGYRIGH